MNSANSLGEADSAAQSKIHDNSNFSNAFLRSKKSLHDIMGGFSFEHA